MVLLAVCVVFGLASEELYATCALVLALLPARTRIWGLGLGLRMLLPALKCLNLGLR